MKITAQNKLQQPLNLEATHGSAADWRKQLRLNDRRTRIVIALFVAIYASIGLLVDLVLHPEVNALPLADAITTFATLRVIPYGTLIMGGVALLSILITYSLHDTIMLFGTDHREITSNNARSLTEKQLYNVVEELKVAAGLRYMPKVYLIDADYMNAFASGYSEKSALVAITTGLIKKLKREELQAVMAHELSHIRHHDIKLTLMASVLTNIMLIVIDILFYSMLYGGGGSSGEGGERRRRDEANGLFITVYLLRLVLPLLTVILTLYLSRTREYMADAGAVELTRDNLPLAQALLKIADDHEVNKEEYAAAYQHESQAGVRRAAYIFDPVQAGISLQQSIAGIFSTHPPLQKRLAALGFVVGRNSDKSK
jgi:heat shock protein HtpX